MPDSPCHGCERRRKGCHSGCEEYIAYADAREAALAAMRADRAPYSVGRDKAIERVEKRRREPHRRRETEE